MKKYGIVLLAVLAVLAFAVSAFAVHPTEPAEKAPVIAKGKSTIELGGSIRFRGDYRADILSLSDDSVSVTPNQAAYDGRIRLHLNAYVSDNTMGRVQLETGSSNKSDTYAWGCSSSDSLNAGVYGEGNCKKGELRILEAWIQHQGSGLLGMPAGFKIGHMPLKLGRGMFLDHTLFGDDAIDFFVKPMNGVTIDLLYTKFTEGTTSDMDDDTDAYALIASYAGSGMNASGDITYLRDKNFVSEKGADVYNIALRGDVALGMAKVFAEVNWQAGKVKADDVALTTDSKFKGYAFVVGADAKMADVNLNVEFGMGSGDEIDEDTGEDTNDHTNTFVTAMSAIQKERFTYVYDYRQFTAAGATNTGVANTTWVRLGADTKVTPDLSVAAELYWLQATEDILIDGDMEDDLGWELDARANYKIDTNLTWYIEGGVLFPGNVYDKIAEAGGVDDEFSTPYVIRHGVILAF